MSWPFRLRHKVEDAPAVKEAIEKRDVLFDELDTAIREVDRVQDRVLQEYRDAEELRPRRTRK